MNDSPALIAQFLDAATADLSRADEILAANPWLAGSGFYVDLVLGDFSRVERELAANPSLAQGTSGPENVEPLIYVCFSRYAGRPGGHAETARIRTTGNPCTTPPNTRTWNASSCCSASAPKPTAPTR